MMDDSFSLLAKQIRAQKMNKKDIENIKKEVIDSKLERNRRNFGAIKVQSAVRGYLARKKYKIKLEKFNIETIIEYLHEKRLKRIHKYSKELIAIAILKFLYKQKKMKNKVYDGYKNFCADFIKSAIKGYIIRKKIKEKLENIRKCKMILLPYVLGHRVRLQMRCFSIQNILKKIADIKYLLTHSSSEDEISILSQKLFESQKDFYIRFYKNKANKLWTREKKVNFNWINEYLKGIKGGFNEEKIDTLKNKIIFNNEPNGVSNGGRRRVMRENREERSEREGNYNSGYNGDNSYSYINTSQNTAKKHIKRPNKRQVIHENNDERPIRPMQNQYSSYDEMPIKGNNVENNGSDEYNNNYNYNENKGKNLYVSYDERPIRPMKNAINNNVNKGETYYDDRPIKPMKGGNNPYMEEAMYDNGNSLNGKNKMKNKKVKSQRKKNQSGGGLKSSEEESAISPSENNNQIATTEVDNRPIGGNKINYAEMFADGCEISEANPFGSAKGTEHSTRSNDTKKNMRKNNKNTKKRPVYDARKAIEEAKLREEKEGAPKENKKYSQFREFLREMKNAAKEEGNKEEKSNMNGEQSPSEKSNKLSKKDSRKKVRQPQKVNNVTQEDSQITDKEIAEKTDRNENYEKEENNDKNNKPNYEKRVPRHEKIKNANIEMRRKLHELERSPPPRLNIKGVKSKLDCWTNNNDRTRSHIRERESRDEGKNITLDLSTTQNKKKIPTNIRNLNNIDNSNISEKQSDIKKSQTKEGKEKEFKDYKVKISKKLVKIEQQLNQISEIFSLNDYFKKKDKKMANYPNFPFIKENINLVKQYAECDYNDIIEQLNAQYLSLK